MTVFQFRGRTAAYLEPAPGMASMDLFRMLREGLLAEVRSATAQAKAENAAAVRDGLQIDDGGKTRLVRIEVVPFKVPPSGIRFFLVLFNESSTVERSALLAVADAHLPDADKRVAQLQQEIVVLRRIPPIGHRGAGKYQRRTEVSQ